MVISSTESTHFKTVISVQSKAEEMDSIPYQMEPLLSIKFQKHNLMSPTKSMTSEILTYIEIMESPI